MGAPSIAAPGPEGAVAKIYWKRSFDGVIASSGNSQVIAEAALLQRCDQRERKPTKSLEALTNLQTKRHGIQGLLAAVASSVANNACSNNVV